jgi:hypothetical protein
MGSICNNFVTSGLISGILCAAIFSGAAKADCVKTQSDVPACLSGTAVAGDYAGAVIQEDGQPGLRQIITGDIVAGWKVEEIGAGYVELKRGANTTRLEMPHSQSANVEEVQQQADNDRRNADRPPHVKRPGPRRHSVISPAADD